MASEIQQLQDILRRLDQLEAEIRQLRQEVARLARSAADQPPAAAPAGPEKPGPKQSPTPFDAEVTPQVWLARLGVLLLFLGLSFLFVYAVQQGWITPWLRVLAGLAVGAVLLTLGWRLAPTRAPVAAILAGGGLAAWYLSLFAAYRLYALVPYGLSFAGMTLVTVLTYLLALTRHHPATAVVGISGGLLTPLALGGGDGELVPLAAYTLLVLIGGAAVYARTGNLPVLTTMWLGGWPLQGLLLWQLWDTFRPSRAEQIAVQVSVTALAAMLWGLPLSRLHRGSSPGHRSGVFLGAWLAPGLALVTTYLVWLDDMRLETLGWLFLTVSALEALLAAWLYRNPDRPGADVAHGVAAVLYSLPGWPMIFLRQEYLQEWVLLAFTMEALALLVLARLMGSPRLAYGGDGMLGVIVLWLFLRLREQQYSPFGPEVITDLLIYLGLLAASHLQADRNARTGYEVAVHALGLGWLARESVLLDWDIGVLSALWAVLGGGEFALAVHRGHPRLYWYGFGILLIVGAKLLLVDTIRVALLWRAVLFLALGVFYVGLGVLGRRALAAGVTSAGQ